MASIERTAYPRFKRSPLAKELDALYTPTVEDLSFALKFARKPQLRFGLLVLLKSFQRLGYFPAIEDVPPTVVLHIQTASDLGAVTLPTYEELRTLYRHHQAIRDRFSLGRAWPPDCQRGHVDSGQGHGQPGRPDQRGHRRIGPPAH